MFRRLNNTQRNAGTVGDVGFWAATFKVSNGWVIQYDAESGDTGMSGGAGWCGSGVYMECSDCQSYD
jgi:hypothetical protein